MTTTGHYLDLATNKLEASSIPTARLDVLILMEVALSIDRAKILAEPNTKISPNNKNVLDKLIDKRSNHMPIAQLINRSEFYGREFYINQDVLEPRPESETMIELLIGLVSSYQKLIIKATENDEILIADIGTGSGALGISAKLEIPKLSVDLIDIDKKALKVAAKNVDLYTINTSIINSDLLNSCHQNYDILLCNLPYVPDDFHINLAASHEPKQAIFGGPDGLDIYRRLFKYISNKDSGVLFILTESLPSSHDQLRSIAKSANYELHKEEDFIQVFFDANNKNLKAALPDANK